MNPHRASAPRSAPVLERTPNCIVPVGVRADLSLQLNHSGRGLSRHSVLATADEGERVSTCKTPELPFPRWISRRPELLIFIVLLAVLNAPILWGAVFRSLTFLPEPVYAGEWWRVFTHPFVHLTWYHLLLDGTAYLALYHSLLESATLPIIPPKT